MKQRPYSMRWIQWASSLTYSEMLEGIEGTGTRNNGWLGSKLRCNLDGVILIKYCVLCLKVSILATILCIFVILPINFTADQCNQDAYDDDTQIEEGICSNTTDLNVYEKTTYANIPSITNITFSFNYVFTSPFTNKDAIGTTLRMIAILVVAFVLYTYTCRK